ncbi:multiple epidermal growth factor-like domains protein 10 isoform X2 [Haliotis rubra]|uniref:multiple epidermal growth factor-like domains protein 10 isoform X2 n=1 Tax=Haliotis rubra TaxID=36100 RepID=UPI001EE586FF|nr:multiple epidermal growth factor-like domains protein 10 isoform X2 [Haliotis rubra]
MDDRSITITKACVIVILTICNLGVSQSSTEPSKDKMSRDRHRGFLPTTFCFAVYMFLLIHHGGSKCVHKTPRHLKKEGCVNHCPSADQCPEECTDCVSGFYGSDCRRSCRGNCLNGRCALLANGRAVNCTEGCVLGWRGLTCSTRCKRPCLECDRYTGDCVGQCRDGFCGPWCLQRCPYPCSKCDKSTGECLSNSSGAIDLSLKKNNMPVALRQTHGNNTRKIPTGNINMSHSSREPHQHLAMPSTSFSDRWTTSPYFPTAIAVLSAVITFIIVGFIFHRMKVAMEQKRKGDQLVNSSQTKRLILLL